MHVYFSGIGGSGISPLAHIAKQAGYDVSGSDKQDSSTIQSLKKLGITSIVIGQETEKIAAIHAEKPIDWFVYSSAVSKENPNHPELVFARQQNITSSKRDEFINKLLKDTDQKMIAIAGTHGKTTTTAMTIWLCQQANIPVSYILGGKITFGPSGHYDKDARYFIYEADEYDRNFLSFTPYMSLISGVAYDHQDIYPTVDDYNTAFREFIGKCEWTIAHPADLKTLSIEPDWHVFSPDNALKDVFTLTGNVNRQNAELVVQGISEISEKPHTELIPLMNAFPGVLRRFEKIANNIYSDYAHTPEKIEGAIGIALEAIRLKTGDRGLEKSGLVIVYEGLHNTRQHFIKKQLETLFKDAKKLYIVPSYRAREDESLEDLTPQKLCDIIQKPEQKEPSQFDERLKNSITAHARQGDLVLCLTAGGGGSLDEWLRANFVDSSL